MRSNNTILTMNWRQTAATAETAVYGFARNNLNNISKINPHHISRELLNKYKQLILYLNWTYLVTKVKAMTTSVAGRVIFYYNHRRSGSWIQWQCVGSRLRFLKEIISLSVGEPLPWLVHIKHCGSSWLLGTWAIYTWIVTDSWLVGCSELWALIGWSRWWDLWVWLR